MARNRIQIIITAQDQASRVLNGIGDNLRNVGRVALIGGAAVGAAVAGIGIGLAKLAIDAAPIADLQMAFEGFTSSIEGGADAMLSALQRTSGGLIANRDLMQSFNTATQLVSKDFAERLPDALGMLGQVAAATGQDLDFLLSSLVTGVGRLSPMILDNLGIQVDLVAAQEAYAASIGKTVSELTKQEQQTALMNQVMERLAVNTADLPDVSESAAAQIARLGATFQNLKDDIGVALLPVITALIKDGFLPLIERIGPALTSFVSNTLVPLFERGANAVSAFLEIIGRGGTFAGALSRAIFELTGNADLAMQVFNLVNDVVQTFNDRVRPVIDTVIRFISENVKLQDVLIALGIAIGAVIVPALAGIAGTVAVVIATFTAAVAVASAVRQAWETNFLGVRDFIIGSVIPALKQLANWLQVNIPVAVQAATNFFNDTFLPAANDLWVFIRDRFMPTALALAEFFRDILVTGVQSAANIFTGTLLPAFRDIWSFIQDNILPILREVAGFIGDTLIPMWIRFNVEAISVVLEALRTFIGFISSDVIPAISSIVTWVGTLRDGFNNLLGPINNVINGISGIASGLPSLGISLPGWLTPGSPTPLETGLLGIVDAMRQANREVVAMGAGFNAPAIAGGSTAAGAAGAGGIGSGTTNNFAITIQAQPGATVEDGRNIGTGFLEALRDEGHG